VIGFLIDPLDFVHSIVDHFPIVAAILIALIAEKWIAAEASRRAFSYSTAARRTMWSLTRPQVAATLAATLVAFHTVNRAGRPLLDARTLNAVRVMVLTTSMLRPLLAQHFAVVCVMKRPLRASPPAIWSAPQRRDLVSGRGVLVERAEQFGKQECASILAVTSVLCVGRRDDELGGQTAGG